MLFSTILDIHIYHNQHYRILHIFIKYIFDNWLFVTGNCLLNVSSSNKVMKVWSIYLFDILL